MRLFEAATGIVLVLVPVTLTGVPTGGPEKPYKPQVEIRSMDHCRQVAADAEFILNRVDDIVATAPRKERTKVVCRVL